MEGIRAFTSRSNQHAPKARVRAPGQSTPTEKPLPIFDGEPQILRPFHRPEAISTEKAATRANRTVRTMRRWCAAYYLGRPVGGNEIAVSAVALEMFLDGGPNSAALKAISMAIAILRP
jgi:hypothetical protein